MALGEALQKRMEELAKRQPAVRTQLAAIAEGATLRAIAAAAEKTPPNSFEDGEIRGVHMITGELAQHWETDSRAVPSQTGEQFTTTLANDKQYASYVNDGHDVDQHFVPGLYVDDEGLLSYDPTGKDKDGKKTGLVVGTKTKKVPGLYMKEAGTEKYQEAAEAELRKLAGEVFQ
ncbi:MAG: HK97 gp10 family phage protein [Lachnospiraceae bacterium]|nr:HK97 gp10 family phage protein [Lachnospiraceae bacterium]